MSFDWDVIRTTTDKLKDELNGVTRDVHQIQYVGGRDWVIIYRQRREREDRVFKGFAARNKGSNQWEITIPSILPDGRPVITVADRAADIQEVAEAAVARTLVLNPTKVQVDIEIDNTRH